MQLYTHKLHIVSVYAMVYSICIIAMHACMYIEHKHVVIDIPCEDLATPANGEIMSCSSGTIGVGYEGDTCSFTCNTGYELTGSDTRTCQSNGSWSATETMCREG